MNNENEPRVPAGQPGGGQWTDYILEGKGTLAQKVTTDKGQAAAEQELRGRFKYDIGEIKKIDAWHHQAPRGGTLEDRQSAVFHKTFTKR